jgi:alpha-L-fucosidase
VRKYTPEDIRYTSKGDTVFAFVMGWPANGQVVLKAMAQGSQAFPKPVAKVELLGSTGQTMFSRDVNGLTIKLPSEKPNDIAYALKITPA